MFEQNQ